MTEVVNWALAQDSVKLKTDKFVLAAIAGRCREDEWGCMFFMRDLMSGANVDCDRIWRSLDRLERKRLLKVCYTDGCPTHFVLMGGGHAV